MKTTFKDLSGWLKALAIFGYICMGYSAIAFVVGFILGFFGYY